MPLLEGLLVPLAQRHHRRHVDLVEGRQHRGGALRLDQPLARSWRAASTSARALRCARRCDAGCRRRTGGDAARHWRLDRRWRRPRDRPEWRRCRRCRRTALRRLFDIAFSSPGRHAGALDAVRLTAFCSAAFLRGRRGAGLLGAAVGHCGGGSGVGRLQPTVTARLAAAPLRRSRRALRRPSRRRRPDGSIRLSTPACGAGTSRLTLSVSSSTSGSPRATASPTFFIQRATRASTIDSPTSGTTIFAGIGRSASASFCNHSALNRTRTLLWCRLLVLAVFGCAPRVFPANGASAASMSDLLMVRVARRRSFRRDSRCAAARSGGPGVRRRRPPGTDARSPSSPCSRALPASTRFRRRRVAVEQRAQATLGNGYSCSTPADGDVRAPRALVAADQVHEDLAGAQDHAPDVGPAAAPPDRRSLLEAAFGEFARRRGHQRMAQQALGRKHDQRQRIGRAAAPPAAAAGGSTAPPSCSWRCAC